jgi:hypothetical protein
MTRAEWRWLLVASALVLAVASLPTVFAAEQADADHVFTGFIYNNEDGNSYLGKMQLGAQGEWLFHIFYTAEPTTEVLAFPFHLVLGQLAAALGLSLVLVYHLARVVFGLILLLTVYTFLARFTPDVAVRRTAWTLVAVGGGLGWLLVLVGLSPWLDAYPLEFWVPEGFAFLVLLNLPHLAAAQSLLYGALMGLLDVAAGAGAERALLAGLMGLGMTLIVPFYAVILAAAAGAWLLALTIRHRAIPWRPIGSALLVGVQSGPLVAYTAIVWSTDPSMQAWTSQNTILSPHPMHYLLAYAPMLIPAVVGGRMLVQRDDAALLPVAWLALVPVLIYLPFTLQRRLIGGAQVPLALMAGLGLVTGFASRPAGLSHTSGSGQSPVSRPGWSPRPALRSRGGSTAPAPAGMPRTALVGYLAVASLSTAVLIAGLLGTARQKAPPAYRPAGEIAAIDWLAAHAGPDETVLSGYAAGNLIPARAGVRVFYGHSVETFDFAHKREMVRRFFEADTDDAWRQALLEDYGIAYVFYGPEEQALGAWDIATAPYLTPGYDTGEVAIYHVAQGQRQP